MNVIYVHRWSELSPMELRARSIEPKEVAEEFSILEVRSLKALEGLAGYHKVAEIISVQGERPELWLDDKAKWTVSFYGEVENPEKIYSELKEWVNESSYKARPVPHRFRWMDGREVSKLIAKGGTEFIVAGLGGRVYLGRTVMVFDYESFKKRDMLRPYHDPKVNIPSRLARALLNLLSARAGERLLDPFCGMGTILQEGAMMGLRPYGLDISKRMVKYARANSAWLAREEGVEDFGARIKVGDARELTRYFREESMDLVATEPVLLPYIKGLPSRRRAMRLLKDAKEVYEAAIEEIVKVLRPGGRLGIVLPGLKTNDGGIATLEVREAYGLEPLWKTVKVEGDAVLRLINTFRKPA